MDDTPSTGAAQAPDRLTLRIGGASAVAGAFLALAGNALHPRTPAPAVGDPVAFLNLVADSPLWVSAHVVIILASLLLLGGLVALSRSLIGGRGAGLGCLALASALLGSALNLAVLAVDGVVIPQFPEAWDAAAARQESSLLLAAALYHLDFGLFAVTVTIFFGVTFILYRLAVSLSQAYPRWLGWVAALGGIGAVVVGLLDAYRGTTPFTFLVLSPLIAAGLSLWLLVMGILLQKRASA